MLTVHTKEVNYFNVIHNTATYTNTFCYANVIPLHICDRTYLTVETPLTPTNKVLLEKLPVAKYYTRGNKYYDPQSTPSASASKE